MRRANTDLLISVKFAVSTCIALRGRLEGETDFPPNATKPKVDIFFLQELHPKEQVRFSHQNNSVSRSHP